MIRGDKRTADRLFWGVVTASATLIVLTFVASRFVRAARHTIDALPRAPGDQALLRACGGHRLDRGRGNYVRLQTGDKSHLFRETMKAVEATLDPAEFLRIHRSALVAVDRIQSIEARAHGEYVVTMKGGAQLVSSRGYRDGIRRLLG